MSGRETVEDEVRWNLDDILRREDFDTALTEAEEALKKFYEWESQMRPEMPEETFMEYAAFSDDVCTMMSRLEYLGGLMSAVDTASSDADLLLTKAKDLLVKYEDAERGISHWLAGKEQEGMQRLDDENAARLFAAVPDLENALLRERELERYILSEPEERVITMKDLTLGSALTEMRTKIEAKQCYFFKPEGRKRGKTLETIAEILRYIRSPRPEEREASYRALFAGFEKNLDLYFLIYQAVVKDWGKEAELRSYSSEIAVRNVHNDIPDAAVDTLLEVCADNRDIFQRWFRFKAKELGMEKLRRFDIYAPLDAEEEAKVTFREAVDDVLTILEHFSPQFAAHARKVIEAGHIDSHPRPTKRSGAFCATVAPDIVPYVLTNFNSTSNSVTTLAHELGHAVHSLYAAHHSASVQEASLPLAETASTLSEMVMFEKLLEDAESDDKRKSLLAKKIDDSYATVMRQAYFVIFEKRAHEAIAKGITKEELSDLWYATLKEQFGDSVDVDECFRHEWAYIPHIVEAPFYCYAYSFGDLLSLSLYGMYKEQGPSFIPKIEQVLAAGGSKKPEKILQEIGIDISSREFWQKSFDILKEMMDRLETYSRESQQTFRR